ncbi:Hypothetical protein GbCGDNIH9_1349 [Granulibacter bethesdensis]|uniref:Secreted protein n=1 Tax=Granulibacter bethesdensis TaxID=364410 RepID=A0AAC9P8L0_9PROT|nr:hypothetical protein [Granulibacter bethesdensis]APH54647.1 Hypothetical protein GbCGDNIH9_1349 [Granulibacter bethesdensis]APH62233.1 Hypothetical protein GbCGDNIH8_1349 [Granulibacter bethesdensis]
MISSRTGLLALLLLTMAACGVTPENISGHASGQITPPADLMHAPTDRSSR